MTAICITKYDAICNLGDNIDEIFQNAIIDGNSHLEKDENFITGQTFYFGKVHANLEPIDQIDYNTRTNRLLCTLAKRMRLDDFIKKYGADNVAVIIATTNSGAEEFSESENEKLSQIGNPAIFLKNMLGTNNYAASISTACSSGIKVFATAKRLIKTGFCKAAIVGGTDALAHLSVHGFNSLEILSNEKTQPFSKNRKGINIGEGAALFTIERNAFGIDILGIGETSDAYHASKPEPTGEQIVNAVKIALKASDLTENDIDYINLHGTGTLANDETEAKSMFKIFKDKTPCSSTKSITGHCLGAAAAIETALCCKCIENGIILKHNYDGAFDENLPKINLAAENSHNNIKYVMNNAFGFGGTNAVMILGKSNLSVEKILPHEFPMILIDEVTEVNFEKNYLVSKVKIKDTMPFFDKTINGISSVAGIEFMAQTIGCYSYLKRGENSPQIGFLLGTRIYNNAVEKFENRKEYFIKVEEIYNDHKICAFGCQIFDDTQDEIACATINAYQPDNLEEILKSDE